MTTDPGDLVLDPTCGSGTTAYVAEGWGRRWITIDTSRVALALARARIMGARYDYYLLSDSREGNSRRRRLKAKRPRRRQPTAIFVKGSCTSGCPTSRSSPSLTTPRLMSFGSGMRRSWRRSAPNCRRFVAWQKRSKSGKFRANAQRIGPPETEPLLAEFWELRVARQKEIDASIAAKADYEYLYDKPYADNKKVRVAGPFTVESLSPHRVLGVDEDDELIDNLADAELGYGETQDFATLILEHLKTSGVQQAHKEDRISFTSIKPWPGDLVCAEGRYVEGDPDSGDEKRAAIFIGPEFGTVSRPDLVEAAREAADADFDLLIACAFSYEAHSTDLDKLGKIPILKARMNADLHMAADLSNTGKGNLFVIFGEPDITVASGLWLVTSKGEKVA